MFRLRIAVNATTFLSSPVNKQLGGRARKQGWSMVYCPSCLVSRLIYRRSTSFPNNIPSNQLYISRIFQIFASPVGYEDLSQSKTAKYFEWTILIINNDGHKKVRRTIVEYTFKVAEKQITGLILGFFKKTENKCNGENSFLLTWRSMLVPKCSTVTASGPRFCCWNCRKPQFQLIWLFRLPITWGLVPFPDLNCQKQLSQHAAFQRDICASTFLSMSIRLTSIILILQHLSNVANAGWRVFICGTFPPVDS